MKVGFIGLGIMGRPMAINLVKAGFSLCVFDIVRERCEPATALGALSGESPQGVAAESDIVITMLPETPHVEAVLFGPQGVWQGVRPGTVVIDMSTISPRASRDFARRLGQKGCEMLDAPVSGGEPGAKAAALGIMAGGKREVFEQCRPLLAAMGKTIVYAGPNGSGLKMKMVNQVIGSLNLLAVVEGVRLAEAAGLELPATLEAVSSGAAASWMLTNLGPKIVSRDFAAGFSIRLNQKDLRLVTELLSELSLECPGAQLVYSLLSQALEKGLGHQGNQGLYNLWA